MAHTPQTRATYWAKVQQRRERWLADNGPCRQCHSWQDLHVHHREPKQKIDHKVWMWRAERRAAELLKCEVLCRACHITTHSLLARKAHGIGSYRRGCRCEICRAARGAQCQRYRAKHRAELLTKALARQAENSFRDRYVVTHDEETSASHVGESGGAKVPISDD